VTSQYIPTCFAVWRNWEIYRLLDITVSLANPWLLDLRAAVIGGECRADAEIADTLAHV